MNGTLNCAISWLWVFAPRKVADTSCWAGNACGAAAVQLRHSSKGRKR